MSLPVWQMVKEAIDHFDREVTYAEIREYISGNYSGVNPTTIGCQIVVSSVNHPSRIHYPENKKPRLANSRYDFLYHTGRGKVCPYDPEIHGEWEIFQQVDGSLQIRLLNEGVEDDHNTVDIGEKSGTFAFESHLRDYLARNLGKVGNLGSPVEVYVDKDGVDGIEYRTPVGIIDILAKAPNGDLYVFELKLGRGPDAALGQILRYMGWVDRHLSNGNNVQGIVLASEISEKLKYAATQVANVRLMEYELQFQIKPVEEK